MAAQVSSAPLVFDRTLVRTRLRRAQALGGEAFLLERAVSEAIDRLAPVRRDFRAILDLATPRPALAEHLALAFPNADLTRAAPVSEPEQRRWRTVVADDERLPFGPERFDLVVSLMAFHTVNDLPGTLIQVRRALKPDGLLVACLLGGQTLHELRTALTVAEVEVSGGASPRVAPFADLRDLGHLLQRAGLALPVTDSDPLTVRYGSLLGLIDDLRRMGAGNALLARGKPLTRRLLARTAEIYAARFGDADGRIRATFELVWLTGWAPHESQQKPLKPGSAKVRLADALKAIAAKP